MEEDPVKKEPDQIEVDPVQGEEPEIIEIDPVPLINIIEDDEDYIGVDMNISTDININMIDKIYLVMQYIIHKLNREDNQHDLIYINKQIKDIKIIYYKYNDNSNVAQKYKVFVRFLYGILKDFGDMANQHEILLNNPPIDSVNINIKLEMLSHLSDLFSKYDIYMKTQMDKQQYNSKFIGKNINDLLEIGYITQKDIEAIYSNEREMTISWLSGEDFYYINKNNFQNIPINDGLFQEIHLYLINDKLNDFYGIQKIYKNLESNNFTQHFNIDTITLINDILQKFEKVKPQANELELYLYYIWETKRNQIRRQKNDFLNIKKKKKTWLKNLLKEIQILYSMRYGTTSTDFLAHIGKILLTYDKLLQYDHLKDYFNIISTYIEVSENLKITFKNLQSAEQYFKDSEYYIPEDLVKTIFLYIKIRIYLNKYELVDDYQRSYEIFLRLSKNKQKDEHLGILKDTKKYLFGSYFDRIFSYQDNKPVNVMSGYAIPYSQLEKYLLIFNNAVIYINSKIYSFFDTVLNIYISEKNKLIILNRIDQFPKEVDEFIIEIYDWCKITNLVIDTMKITLNDKYDNYLKLYNETNAIINPLNKIYFNLINEHNRYYNTTPSNIEDLPIEKRLISTESFLSLYMEYKKLDDTFHENKNKSIKARDDYIYYIIQKNKDLYYGLEKCEKDVIIILNSFKETNFGSLYSKYDEYQNVWQLYTQLDLNIRKEFTDFERINTDVTDFNESIFSYEELESKNIKEFNHLKKNDMREFIVPLILNKKRRLNRLKFIKIAVSLLLEYRQTIIIWVFFTQIKFKFFIILENILSKFYNNEEKTSKKDLPELKKYIKNLHEINQQITIDMINTDSYLNNVIEEKKFEQNLIVLKDIVDKILSYENVRNELTLLFKIVDESSDMVLDTKSGIDSDIKKKVDSMLSDDKYNDIMKSISVFNDIDTILKNYDYMIVKFSDVDTEPSQINDIRNDIKDLTIQKRTLEDIYKLEFNSLIQFFQFIEYISDKSPKYMVRIYQNKINQIKRKKNEVIKEIINTYIKYKEYYIVFKDIDIVEQNLNDIKIYYEGLEKELNFISPYGKLIEIFEDQVKERNEKKELFEKQMTNLVENYVLVENEKSKKKKNIIIKYDTSKYIKLREEITQLKKNVKADYEKDSIDIKLGDNLNSLDADRKTIELTKNELKLKIKALNDYSSIKQIPQNKEKFYFFTKNKLIDLEKEFDDYLIRINKWLKINNQLSLYVKNKTSVLKGISTSLLNDLDIYIEEKNFFTIQFTIKLDKKMGTLLDIFKNETKNYLRIIQNEFNELQELIKTMPKNPEHDRLKQTIKEFLDSFQQKFFPIMTMEIETNQSFPKYFIEKYKEDYKEMSEVLASSYSIYSQNIIKKFKKDIIEITKKNKETREWDIIFVNLRGDKMDIDNKWFNDESALYTKKRMEFIDIINKIRVFKRIDDELPRVHQWSKLKLFEHTTKRVIEILKECDKDLDRFDKMLFSFNKIKFSLEGESRIDKPSIQLFDRVENYVIDREYFKEWDKTLKRLNIEMEGIFKNDLESYFQLLNREVDELHVLTNAFPLQDYINLRQQITRYINEISLTKGMNPENESNNYDLYLTHFQKEHDENTMYKKLLDDLLPHIKKFLETSTKEFKDKAKEIKKKIDEQTKESASKEKELSLQKKRKTAEDHIENNHTEATAIYDHFRNLFNKINFIQQKIDIKKIPNNQFKRQIQSIINFKEATNYKSPNKKLPIRTIENMIYQLYSQIRNIFNLRKTIEKLKPEETDKILSEMNSIKSYFDNDLKDILPIIDDIYYKFHPKPKLTKKIEFYHKGNIEQLPMILDKEITYLFILPRKDSIYFFPVFLIFIISKDRELDIKYHFSLKNDNFIQKIHPRELKQTLPGIVNKISLQNILEIKDDYIITKLLNTVKFIEGVFQKTRDDKIVNKMVDELDIILMTLQNKAFSDFIDILPRVNSRTTEIKTINQIDMKNLPFMIENYNKKFNAYIQRGVGKKYKTQFKVFNNIIQNHIIIEKPETRKMVIDLIIIYISLQGKELENLTLYGVYYLEYIQYILNISLKFNIKIPSSIHSLDPDFKNLIFLPNGREYYYKHMPSGLILEVLPIYPMTDKLFQERGPELKLNDIKYYKYNDTEYIKGELTGPKINEIGLIFGSAKDKEYTFKNEKGDTFIKKFIVDKDYTLWIKFNEVYQPFNFNDKLGQKETILEDNIAYVAYVEQ